MRASFAPSPPCDDGRLPRCACHHTTCLGALWYQTQTRSPLWVLGSEKTPHNPSSITPESLLPCLCAPWRGLRRVIFFPARAVNPQTRTATASIRSIIALPMLTFNRSALWYDLDKNGKGIIDEAVSQLEPDDGEI